MWYVHCIGTNLKGDISIYMTSCDFSLPGTHYRHVGNICLKDYVPNILLAKGDFQLEVKCIARILTQMMTGCFLSYQYWKCKSSTLDTVDVIKLDVTQISASEKNFSHM